MLLWLSLICRLPFDLAQFDEPETLGKTASDLEAVAKINLDRAGVEREGAATLLSRLYARQVSLSKHRYPNIDDLPGMIQTQCSLHSSNGSQVLSRSRISFS